jgi:hypothetical protein
MKVMCNFGFWGRVSLNVITIVGFLAFCYCLFRVNVCGGVVLILVVLLIPLLVYGLVFNHIVLFVFKLIQQDYILQFVINVELHII